MPICYRPKFLSNPYLSFSALTMPRQMNHLAPEKCRLTRTSKEKARKERKEKTTERKTMKWKSDLLCCGTTKRGGKNAPLGINITYSHGPMFIKVYPSQLNKTKTFVYKKSMGVLCQIVARPCDDLQMGSSAIYYAWVSMYMCVPACKWTIRQSTLHKSRPASVPILAIRAGARYMPERKKT